MQKNKRMANIELLRILAMVMVVVMHFLYYSNSLMEAESAISSRKIIGTLMEAFCLVAVNTYVFISGYFGVKVSFKPSKAVALLCQIWFYSILIPLVLMALGVPTSGYAEGKLNIYGFASYFFPIETEHYWFATAYFMLYLITPVLGTAVKNMSRRQMQITLGGLLILFSVVKSVSPIAFVVDKYGYDLVWFICVYLTAAYFSLYGGKIFERKGWIIYIVSATASFLLQMFLWAVCQKSSSFAYYFTVPFHYNFILCLTGAIGLFYGFLQINIKEGRLAQGIRKLGPLSFGIYLLHEHIDLRRIWYEFLGGMVNPGRNQGVQFFFLELFFCLFILFAAGMLIDWMRSRLFLAAGNVLRKTWVMQKLKELDEEGRG